MESRNSNDNVSVGDAIISIEDWMLFWKRAVSYTYSLLRNKYYVASEKGLGGKTAEDFAEEIIEKLLTGERNWNKKNHPELFSQFKSSIDSHVYNFMIKKRLIESSFDHEIKDSHIPESEDIIELEDYAINVLASLKASDDEILVFQCQIGGLFKPSEIADELGISAQEVYNIKKRLNRKLPELQKRLRNYGI